MQPIQIKSLSQIENEEILNCFNMAFSDYSIPFWLSLEELEIKLHSESVAKSISVGAFKENKLIGFVLHGKRSLQGVRTAYNAGTGMIPKERGQGVTQKMYEFIRPILKQEGFKTVFLEVISTNISAISVYEKVGFKKRRHLSCFKGKPNIPRVNTEVRIIERTIGDFDTITPFGEVQPTWQNSRETILKLGDSVRYFLAFLGNDICGYCVFNRANHRILQIAVKNEFRNRLIGTGLLHHVQREISEPISIINVDDEFKSISRFFENRNMAKTLGQIEMELQLTND